MPRYKSPYRGDLPLLPVAPLDGNMGIMGISDPSGVQSPNGVSIVDKSSEGGQEDGIGDGTSHRVVLTPPHHSQRRRSKRGSGRRSATSSPLGKRHVYVVKEDMARVLKRWGMGFDASSMEPFLRRFTSDHNDTLVDYTEFVMIVAEVLRPGEDLQLIRASHLISVMLLCCRRDGSGFEPCACSSTRQSQGTVSPHRRAYHP